MKRREVKFVPGSPRLPPDRIATAPRVRPTRNRRPRKARPDQEAADRNSTALAGKNKRR